MKVTSRAGWAMGLLGLVFWVSASWGQQGDGTVQKAATNTNAPARAAATTIPPAVIGSVDLMVLLDGYEKMKFYKEQLKGEFQSKSGELLKMQADAKQIMKEMQSFQPGSKDFKDRDAKLNQIKANFNAAQETGEHEMQLREAEQVSIVFKEIQDMVARVAYHKQITYVMTVSNAPINPSIPQTVGIALTRPVIYSDPRTDITKDVLYNLNLEYAKNGGQVAKPSDDTPAAEKNSAAPANSSTRQPATTGAAAKGANGRVVK